MKNKNVIRTPEYHPLTWRIRDDHQPVWLAEYEGRNGYRGMRKAFSIASREVITLIKNSGLRGRGGGGFLTGLKWSMMMPESVSSRHVSYLICNADEMEPGTYKDRFLMERMPHLLIEGILIAAYAIQAHRGYIFLRYEYIESAKYLQRAINEATHVGLIGDNILSTGFNFELFIHTGAGRYICGEETALINSLEGRRPIPRAKPPFPSHVGIWGKPTCVNNVETLCNLPAILDYGVDWYKGISLGKSNDTGTKLMGFSGHVNNPGIWEFPFGITAREILEDYAGGMIDRATLKAWQPGGASTAFLTIKHIDVPMDFDSIANFGSRLGTAMSIAVSNNISMVSLVRNLEEFFSRESCGWCTPCRDGLPWILKILVGLENNNGHVSDIAVLKKMCRILGPGNTFCAHAPGAVEPLKSALRYFEDEFMAGVLLL
ncbi:NADH-quinone oxidoreductase subunit NuoF [Blochmannia endosymbiont of Polyrhachis (Hedomyrma) turneri]|uniref:NADH-quinone oxidoreductase subunit NuoF n=1 Tax=Blochmannia endosymbiont of Polyrhachis (Hedomyrma) turneri TaxID=1505596 RepID=UPI00061A851B|nr:NADH-quinone oxidoreductase subunit NuoF [Blochmannia endosymbiont of Polyrhachis (Hedomyrma) turneri]AKC60051.1 NADH-quinone oxidoreductase subunit F [Blochmannia endosymbiont of Polyrhachis (Hedomyrma) turneri]